MLLVTICNDTLHGYQSHRYKHILISWKSQSDRDENYISNPGIKHKIESQLFYRKKKNWLVVWNINFIFPWLLGLAFIIPIDELHHFSEGFFQPPTSLYLYLHKFVSYRSLWFHQKRVFRGFFFNHQPGLFGTGVLSESLRIRGSCCLFEDHVAYHVFSTTNQISIFYKYPLIILQPYLYLFSTNIHYCILFSGVAQPPTRKKKTWPSQTDTDRSKDLIRAILGSGALSKPVDATRSLRDYVSAWELAHEISH